MNRRALLISLLAAMVSVVMLLLYTRHFEQEMSGGDRIKMLIAVKPVERGKLVSDDMLSTRDVPIAYVENRGVRASDRSKIIGVAAANNVQAHDLLMWTDLAVNTEEHAVFRKAARIMREHMHLELANDVSGQAQKAFGVKSLPWMVIIGRDGRILAVHHGYDESQLDDVVADINRALQSRPVAAQ